MEFKRGDVFRIRYPKPDNPSDVIIKYSVILQEGKIADKSPTVVVVNLTTQPDKLTKLYPTDVLVDPSECKTTSGAKIICNQIHTVPKSRILDYKYTLSSDTMLEVNEALTIGIGLVKLEDLEAERTEQNDDAAE